MFNRVKNIHLSRILKRFFNLWLFFELLILISNRFFLENPEKGTETGNLFGCYELKKIRYKIGDNLKFGPFFANFEWKARILQRDFYLNTLYEFFIMLLFG